MATAKPNSKQASTIRNKYERQTYTSSAPKLTAHADDKSSIVRERQTVETAMTTISTNESSKLFVVLARPSCTAEWISVPVTHTKNHASAPIARTTSVFREKSTAKNGASTTCRALSQANMRDHGIRLSSGEARNGVINKGKIKPKSMKNSVNLCTHAAQRE